MARLPFWSIGDDTPSPEHLKQFADYLRTGIASDLEGSVDRTMAINALEWIADLLDAESGAPFILRPVRKAKSRPKGSGANWYVIGREVDELIQERLRGQASVSGLELSRARGAAIRAVAKTHRLTPRAVRTLFDHYQSATAEYEREMAEFWASESEE